VRYFKYTTPCTHQDINKLQTEVLAVIPSAVSIMKINEHVTVFTSEELTLYFTDLVDSTVAAFVDTDLEQKEPKIYDYVCPSLNGKHFAAIDYKMELTTSLFPKRTVAKGEVTRVDWYADVELTNLILKVDINYTREATGFAGYRDTVRTWINKDGTENEVTKTTKKYYNINHVDQIIEGIRRRSLLVRSIQMPVLSMMVEALMPLGYSQDAVLLRGREFLDEYEEEFDRFINNSSSITDPADPNFGKKTVAVKLEEEARVTYTEWLDKAPASMGGLVTIRQYLVSEFDI